MKFANGSIPLKTIENYGNFATGKISSLTLSKNHKYVKNFPPVKEEEKEGGGGGGGGGGVSHFMYSY